MPVMPNTKLDDFIPLDPVDDVNPPNFLGLPSYCSLYISSCQDVVLKEYENISTCMLEPRIRQELMTVSAKIQDNLTDLSFRYLIS